MARADFTSMPQNVNEGFRDKSVPDPIAVPKQFATHLPLWLIFAKKGPTGRVLADGATREQLFGSETFEATSKFFTHQTQFANTVNTRQQSIYQRIHAPDAKASAVRIWLDVLPKAIPLYQRGTDGKIKLDSGGAPIPTGSTTPGYVVKFVKTVVDAQGSVHGGQFGQASQMVGDQVNSSTATQSTRFPLFDIPAAFVGKYGDDLGFRMWAPVAGSRVTPDVELLTVNKAYPYIFACLDRSSDTIKNIQTTAGGQEITAVLKRDQIKASLGAQVISFEPRFFEMYNDRQRRNYAPLYGPFNEVHVYYDNLETLLKQFYTAEQSFIDGFSDFDGSGFTSDDVGEIHRFNFVSGKSSKAVPYHSFTINRSDSNALSMSDISTVWGEGGSDGTMDLDTFDNLVAAEIAKYGDINERVTDDRLGNPESIFYDSGFGIDTKMTLAQFIAVRKDTFLVWCLQDAQQTRANTSDEESSLATSLYTRGTMMPESTEYATPAARFMIVACDGRLINGSSRKRLPLSLELAAKSAAYMGAGNGLWNGAERFDHGDKAKVTMFHDINVTWRPIAARERDWANGMVYVQSCGMDEYTFPALRTGYSVEQSVCTSFITMQAFVDLQKVADRVWIQFSGASGYSNEQFKKRVEQFCRDSVEGKYDARIKLVFTVNFSAVDEYNGYSWTLNIDAGADPMRTVQYTLLTGYRSESMPVAA